MEFYKAPLNLKLNLNKENHRKNKKDDQLKVTNTTSN